MSVLFEHYSNEKTSNYCTNYGFFLVVVYTVAGAVASSFAMKNEMRSIEQTQKEDREETRKKITE